MAFDDRDSGAFPRTEETPLVAPTAAAASATSPSSSAARPTRRRFLLREHRSACAEGDDADATNDKSLESARRRSLPKPRDRTDDDDDDDDGSSSPSAHVIYDPDATGTSVVPRGLGRRTALSVALAVAAAAMLSLLLLLLVSMGVVGPSTRSVQLDGSLSADAGFENNPTQNAASASSSSSSASFRKDLRSASVASDTPVCSRVGTDILRSDGGNAIDAAVATALCLGVANPSSSGLGGGAFLLVRSSRSHFEDRETRHRAERKRAPPFEDARDLVGDDGGSGGDAAGVVDDPGFVTEVIDCREVAPGGASGDMYTGKSLQESSVGGLSVPVPGELRGLELLHHRHGKLPWKTVVEPARKLARDGVRVDFFLAKEIGSLFTSWWGYLDLSEYDFGGLRAYLTGGAIDDEDDPSRPPERFLREGDLLKNPALAETLGRIAEDGADAVYKGPLAEGLAGDIRASGGIVTASDLEEYRAVLRTPVSAAFAGHTLVGIPPPSSGGATIAGIVRFLAGYAEPFAARYRDLSIYRMTEGMRHAFAIRMSLSDPVANPEKNRAAVADLVAGPYMENLRANWTSDGSSARLSEYGGPRWAQFHDGDGGGDDDVETQPHGSDRRRRLLRQQPGSPFMGDDDRRGAQPFGYLEDHGTSHFSVVDSEGNSVAVTTSINNVFGSFVYSETTGIVLGNTMGDFAVPTQSFNYFGLTPSEENFIAPGKRPLSSMSPTIVLKSRKTGDGGSAPPTSEGGGGGKWGDLVLVLGGSGGPKIISSVLQVIVNVLFLGLSLPEAVAKPRVHDQILYHDSLATLAERSVLPDGTALEVPERTKDALRNRHHDVDDMEYAGCVQAVLVDRETDTLTAVSDGRKSGSPDGY